jgi:hypothetical protein
MSAAQPASIRFLIQESRMTTLLELVRAIGELTDDEAEVVAIVRHMLATGSARLCGNFRGSGSEDFL